MSVERRAGAKGNTHQQSTHWTPSQARVSQALERIRRLVPLPTRGRSRMRESRTYGSGRGACDETHVPTATTPRVHHAFRRRGGRVAAGGARAAGRADAAHRRASAPRPRTTWNFRLVSERSCRDCKNCPGPSAATCGSKLAGLRPTLTAFANTCGIGRARPGRHSSFWRFDCGAIAAGDAHGARRVPGRRRSGRRQDLASMFDPVRLYDL